MADSDDEQSKNSRFSFSMEKIQEIDKDPLLGESDRGCVLILATDLENRLASMLTLWFKEIGELAGKHEKSLFDYTGPLGTFSSKISLSKALGFISQEIYHDLNIIKDIRNKAAHSNQRFSLSEPDIKRLMKLLYINPEEENFIQRYSPVKHDGQVHESPAESENVLKGMGFVRFDKVNYIHSLRKLEIQLHTCEAIVLLTAKKIRESFIAERDSAIRFTMSKLKEKKSPNI